eukprot:403343955
MKQSVIKNLKEEIEQKCGRKLGASMHELFTLIERFQQNANIVKEDKRMMDFDSFREILGILGNFSISERMFYAIDDDRDGLITLEDYLIYNDIIAYGTEREKDFVTFKIFDIQGKGKVSYDDFKIFWSQFLELYGEALQTKLQCEEELVEYAFKEIAGEKPYFDFPAFEEAKKSNPQLLMWLEQPGQFLQENVKESFSNKKIDFQVLDDYHSQVMCALDDIENSIESMFGLQRQFTPRDISLKNPTFGGILRSKTIIGNNIKKMTQANHFKQRSQFQIPKTGKLSEIFLNTSPDKTHDQNILIQNTPIIPFQKSANLNDILIGFPRSQSNFGSPLYDSPYKQQRQQFHAQEKKEISNFGVFESEVVKEFQEPNIEIVEDSDDSMGNDTNEEVSLIISQEGKVEKNLPISMDIKHYEKQNRRKVSQDLYSSKLKSQLLNNRFLQPSLLGGIQKDKRNFDHYETPAKLSLNKKQSLDAQDFIKIQDQVGSNFFRMPYENDLIFKNHYSHQTKINEDKDCQSQYNINKDQGKKILEVIRDEREKLMSFITKTKNDLDTKRKAPRDRAKSGKVQKGKFGFSAETPDGENDQSGNVGQVIRIGHEKFDLILNIMIGIKKSISNLVEIPFLEMSDKQFLIRQRLENQWISNANTKESKIKDFKFFDYAPMIFQRIRRLSEIPEEDYLQSLGPDSILNCFWNNNYSSLYELCSSGKSGSLFYYTEDQKYMLKTISRDEFKKLKEILKQYYNHIQNNPFTLITKFFGLHKVSWTVKAIIHKKYLVVMNNVFRDFDVGIRFDLKGSTQGRRTLKPDEPLSNAESDLKTALKDLDFMDHIRQIRFINFRWQSQKPKIEEILTKDAEFFAQTKILDYSLLLGRLKDPEEIASLIMTGEIQDDGIYFTEDGQAYIAGIIDILTEYTSKKRIEYGYKRIKYGTSMSCLPPDQYAKRFSKFMKQIIVTVDQPIEEEEEQQQNSSKVNL